MNDVHLGHRVGDPRDAMLVRDMEVKLNKRVDPLAPNRDLVLVIVLRRRDLNVVSGVPDGGFAGEVFDADSWAWRGRWRSQIDGGLPFAAALVVRDRESRPLRRTGISPVGETRRAFVVSKRRRRSEQREGEQMEDSRRNTMTGLKGLAIIFVVLENTGGPRG